MQSAATSAAGVDPNGAIYPPSNGSAASSGLPMPGMAQTTAQYKPEPGVKMEPGMDNAGMANFGDGNTVAQQRVIDQLQNQYGERAAGSIEKLKGSFTASGSNGAPGQQRPGIPMPQTNQYPGNGTQQHPHSQMDGADDSEGISGILMYQTASGQQREMGRLEIDSLLHAQISARAKAMEGGGFMVPLKRTKEVGKSSQPREPMAAMMGPSQYDGADDDDDLKDEEEDEDAINSDLDDPDDNLDDDDEDEDGGQIMLCMYDKVQRVKNKWKCVLKDGVLSINGKDYVFHKATGEYEW
ncbi:transcription factor IIA, alpha/beta subunit [Microdochium trichocladiopsis]|uniref:Transcription factor IIA, alpha/beta subunit n=1 Tax=Microdochium trichocladiopsis TaxID=1682393 RepID=A0A9P8Y265_9PEZI|nr:transcription factor IIA, alpha/beta subunit [Microdochium trichocladiopsis]KAH7027751.1 transcription factor IIA, alpha/beta subunit [Microdochium trichocladiopsis]